MRTYTLTDRDFEEFFNLMCALEDKARLKYGDQATISGRPVSDTMSSYRYHFIGWRNRVMSGDMHRPMDYDVADDTRSRWKQILALTEERHTQGGKSK